MLAPPLIAFGFSSSVHTQHHHAIYRLDARVVARHVVSLVIGFAKGDDFSSRPLVPQFSIHLARVFQPRDTVSSFLSREGESGSKWKRTTFRRTKNGSYASYFVLSRAVRRLIRRCIIFQYYANLWPREEGRERERGGEGDGEEGRKIVHRITHG